MKGCSREDFKSCVCEETWACPSAKEPKSHKVFMRHGCVSVDFKSKEVVIHAG